MVEIERKFRVRSLAYREVAVSMQRIVQGFLNTDPERTVRVRIKEGNGYLTIKGKSSENGTTRYEWEQEIPLKDAKKLMEICESGSIEKIRYAVPFGGHVFEIDEFQGKNAGLIVAEVELQHEGQAIERPEWLGEEVTGDSRYYNSQLNKQPYKTWKI